MAMITIDFMENTFLKCTFRRCLLSPPFTVVLKRWVTFYSHILYLFLSKLWRNWYREFQKQSVTKQWVSENEIDGGGGGDFTMSEKASNIKRNIHKVLNRGGEKGQVLILSFNFIFPLHFTAITGIRKMRGQPADRWNFARKKNQNIFGMC